MWKVDHPCHLQLYYVGINSKCQIHSVLIFQGVLSLHFQQILKETVHFLSSDWDWDWEWDWESRIENRNSPSADSIIS